MPTAATAAPGRRRAEVRPDPCRRAGSRLGRQDPAQGDDAAVRLPDHPDHRHTRQNERSSPPPEIEVLEKAIAALTAQLKEKDKQIETLTTLLYREQELQAHSHKLLGDSAEEKPPEVTVYEENKETEAKPKEEPKHGFFYWLFH